MENAAFPFYMVLLRDKISWQHFTFTSVPIYLITCDCTRVNTDIRSSLILCIDLSIYLFFQHCSQFHQHYTRTFFVQIFWQSQNVTRKSCRSNIRTKNSLVKGWWNWHLDTEIQNKDHFVLKKTIQAK